MNSWSKRALLVAGMMVCLVGCNLSDSVEEQGDDSDVGQEDDVSDEPSGCSDGCGDGYVCYRDICYESCNSEADCDDKAQCWEGHCAPLDCEGVQCDEDEVCYRGVCYSVCNSDEDCVHPGAKCVEGACVCDGDCCVDEDCLGTAKCAGGSCVCEDECCVDEDCPGTAKCDGESCVCEDECCVDDDCAGLLACVEGECLCDSACCVDDDCEGFEECEDGECVCDGAECCTAKDCGDEMWCNNRQQCVSEEHPCDDRCDCPPGWYCGETCYQGPDFGPHPPVCCTDPIRCGSGEEECVDLDGNSGTC